MSPVVQKLSLGICRGGVGLCYQAVAECSDEAGGSDPRSTSSCWWKLGTVRTFLYLNILLCKSGIVMVTMHPKLTGGITQVNNTQKVWRTLPDTWATLSCAP